TVIRHDFALGQRTKRLTELLLAGRGTEEREDAATPEDVAEHARGTEQMSLLVAQRFEARLHHRDQRFRRLIPSTLCLRAKKLFEVQRAAVRATDDARDAAWMGAFTEHVADQHLRGHVLERSESNLLSPAFRPESRERFVYFGSC